MMDQTLFKKHFVGRDGFQWWVGQIPPEESWRENKTGTEDENNQKAKGFGERYRVRIMGYHTANADDIPDEELPWAYVMYPVTAGGGGRGSSQNANLTQGTFVFGWFMDGEDAQLPVIMGVLGHNDVAAVMKNITPTRFLPFDGYPAEDESFGSERSTFQVRENGGDEILAQENAQGEITNEQYTSSATGSTTLVTVSDPKPDPPDPIPPTSECEPVPLNGISVDLKNALNEIEKINQMIYDARGAITAGIADVQRYIENVIKGVSGKIAGVIKSIYAELEKNVLKLLNLTVKPTFSLIPPDLRENLRLAIAKAQDVIACVWTALSGQLPDLVSGFLGNLFGLLTGEFTENPVPTKAVNIPGCLVQDFIAVTLGNVIGEVANAIDSALSEVSNIVGSVGDIVGGIMDIVNDIIALLQCLKKPKCPQVTEWSMTSGAGGGDAFDIDSLLKSAESISGSITQLGNFGEDIDFSDVFDNLACDVGPRDCGPPTLSYGGPGAGAAINLIVSAAGEVIGADVLNSGFGFIPGQSFLKVYDDCGNGNGAIVKPIFGPVIGIVPGPVVVGGGPFGDGLLPDDIIVVPNPNDPFIPGGSVNEDTAGNTIVGKNPNTGKDVVLPSRRSQKPGEINNTPPTSENVVTISDPNGDGTGGTGSGTGGSNFGTGGTGSGTGSGDGGTGSGDGGTGSGTGGSNFGTGGTGSGTGSDVTVVDLPKGSDGKTTGIIDVIVIQPGYGYLPSPDGSSGGDGTVWKKPDQTTIIGDGSFIPGNGGITPGVPGFGNDYYPPIPPGNTVVIPPGGTVTTPPNSNLTEGIDSDGNGVEILPGTPTFFPNGGSMTSPSLMEGLDIDSIGRYPSTSSYPVVMYLCELIVGKSGMDYKTTDEVVIEPNVGATATPKFDKFGRLLSIKVTSGGEGFKEVPKVYIKSNSGFGSQITPKFCIDRIGQNDLERDPGLQDKVVSVIDCVGNF